jgi:hypothetical protein
MPCSDGMAICSEESLSEGMLRASCENEHNSVKLKCPRCDGRLDGFSRREILFLFLVC